jgi:hypothetical protein
VLAGQWLWMAPAPGHAARPALDARHQVAPGRARATLARPRWPCCSCHAGGSHNGDQSCRLLCSPPLAAPCSLLLPPCCCSPAAASSCWCWCCRVLLLLRRLQTCRRPSAARPHLGSGHAGQAAHVDALEHIQGVAVHLDGIGVDGRLLGDEVHAPLALLLLRAAAGDVPAWARGGAGARSAALQAGAAGGIAAALPRPCGAAAPGGRPPRSPPAASGRCP